MDSISCSYLLDTSFTNPLTPTIKKYLDIKGVVTGPQPALTRLASTMEVKGQLSSSTSTVSSTRVTSKSFYPQTHVRSASSASSSNDQSGHGKAITATKSIRQALKASDLDMPPPQYVPVRPSQSSNTAVSISRSTSSVDAPKRTASGSVGSGTGLSTAVQSGFLVRPTSASGLSEAKRRPHCSSTVSNSSDERSASGPRRVPLPEVKPQAPDTNKNTRGIGMTVTRPLPTHTQSRVNPIAIKKASERSKPQSRGIASSSADVPLSGGKPARSVSQPTLSQLSRIQANERKIAAATIVKPHWGQVGRYKTKSSMKSTTNQQAAHKISKAQTEPRPMTPCQVPLPPSPRPGTPRSLTSSATHVSPPAVLLPPPQDTLQTSANASPTAEHTEEGSVQVATVIGIEKDVEPLALDTGDADSDRDRALPLHRLSDDRDSEVPSAHGTPGPFSSDDHIDISITKTPISTLLTSIQRGFLLTPSSPLSPPQSYLYRDSVSSEGGRAFNTHVSHTGSSEQTMLPLKKPFLFGVAGEDTGRPALSNVENLDVHR